MHLSDYQQLSKRTLNKSLSKNETIHNMIYGVYGEFSECSEILKKHFFQGHELDLQKVKDEIGDTLFYLVGLATALDLNMDDIADKNYNKLLKRYPNGFSVEDSEKRVDYADK